MGDPVSIAVVAMKVAAALFGTCETVVKMISQHKFVAEELNGFGSRLQAFAALVKSLQTTIETN